MDTVGQIKRDLTMCQSPEMVDRLLYKKYGYYFASKRFAIISFWMKKNGFRTPYQQFADIRKEDRMQALIDKMDSETIQKICAETVNVEAGENKYRHGRITASSCGKYLECYKKSRPPCIFETHVR